MAIRFDVQRKVVLVILAVVAIAFAWILETTKVSRELPGYETKRQAAELAAEAYTTLERHYRTQFGDLTPAQLQRDPGRTGLIGTDSTGNSFLPLVNAGGSSIAKQRAVNPNFAALLVDYFQELGLEGGDLVAVAVTGSYPGMNVNLYAAIEAMGLRPVVITSVCGSRYGATRPDFTWLDMERVLDEENVLKIRSVAATPGGANDRGENLTPEGLDLVWAAAERNRAEPLHADDLDHSIAKRMEIYAREAGGQRYQAYVNIGGSTASLGIGLAEARDLHGLHTGLHRDLWRKSADWGHKGTMILMGEGGIPVIQIGETQAISRRYGFSMSHNELRRIPEVGEGTALTAEAYKTSVALLLLVIYIILLIVLVLPELRQRIFGKPVASTTAGPAAAGD